MTGGKIPLDTSLKTNTTYSMAILSRSLYHYDDELVLEPQEARYLVLGVCQLMVVVYHEETDEETSLHLE